MEEIGVLRAGGLSDGALHRLISSGRVRRVATGLYTWDTGSGLDEVVRRWWRELVVLAMPGAVVVDRSAVSARPMDGYLFVDVGPEGRPTPLKLPGLTVVTRRGPGPVAGDQPLVDGLWLASRARTLVDNTRSTRSRGGRPAATLTAAELGDWVDHLAAVEGVERLGALRHEAERLAPLLGVGLDPDAVSSLLGAAIGTRQVATPSARRRARQRGEPYDHQRVELFDVLARHLDSVAPTPIPEGTDERRRHLPFFEAYFSNFIEGTELDLAEARAVLYDGQRLVGHPEDGHDVQATYELVIDPVERAAIAVSFDDFLDGLGRRHRHLMAARPEADPGRLKEVSNRAGTYVFVAPNEVVGTLRRGWELLDSLGDPFGRAVMAMFVVAEVHPFRDGNGRLARLVMNAELSAAGQSRIIVPTVYRGEYLSALTALSANRRPDAIERVLGFAQRWTAQIDFGDLAGARRQLELTNALVDPGVALQEGIKLRLLGAVPADELADDARLAGVARPTEGDARSIGTRMDRSAPW